MRIVQVNLKRLAIYSDLAWRNRLVQKNKVSNEVSTPIVGIYQS
jgi:hypothetical protein